MSEHSEVTLRWEGTTAVVTIDRPEARNALGGAQIELLTARLREASANEELAALVLTGNGPFCAGGDLKALKTTADNRSATPRTYELPHGMIRALLEVPAPTIAALDGPAVGMGLDIALACDSRLIGPRGWIRQGWAKYGAIPATGGLVFLQHLAPHAVWFLLDGQPSLDGPAAASWGLGEAVVEGTALDAALARAGRLAEIPASARRSYVRLLRAPVRAALETQFAEYAVIQAELFNGGAFGARVGEALGSRDARS